MLNHRDRNAVESSSHLRPADYSGTAGWLVATVGAVCLIAATYAIGEYKATAALERAASLALQTPADQTDVLR